MRHVIEMARGQGQTRVLSLRIGVGFWQNSNVNTTTTISLHSISTQQIWSRRDGECVIHNSHQVVLISLTT